MMKSGLLRAPRTRAGLLLVAYVWLAQACGIPPSANDEWHHYANDLGSTKYSPLDLINQGNVSDLGIAWEWESADYELLDAYPEAQISNNYQATPLMVDGVMYVPTNLGQVAALDPATGAEIWRYNAVADGVGNLNNRTTRGVAYWSDGTMTRIFGVAGEFLVSLNVETGRPDAGFGQYGKVHLRVDPDPRVTTYRWTSAPLVVGDVVIVGSTQVAAARNSYRAPPGYIRAYDVRTGAQVWRFNPIAQPGVPGHETWEDSSWAYTGDANAWTLMSADPVRGLVFLPLKTTTNDWYGGHRPGNNVFGESLVCLDAATGELVWYYQLVHHGLWDYDLPAAPILADMTFDGRTIPAVVQVTKQGFVFVFDRTTGEPVWPIEERPVPPSSVPGEQVSPTQPVPTRPAPFERQGVTEDDLIDFTPALRAEAVGILHQYEFGPLFTPPLVGGTGGKLGSIQLPGWVGGANWTGAALDPETHWLYVPSATFASVVALTPPESDEVDFDFVRGEPTELPLVEGLPMFKPPYGRVTAINLDTGDQMWMVPNGEGPRDVPALAGLDLPWLGQPGRPAPLLTRTLLFLGEGTKDGQATPALGGGPLFRAYDKMTGEVAWEIALPAGTTGAPMTYAVDGKQYIVVAVGDGETRGRLIALSLP